MSDAAPSPVLRAPIALWRAARAFLETLHALFGGPERVAFQHTFTAHAHAQLAQWLRCAEAMLRRLLIIEAAAYPAADTPAPARTPRVRVRQVLSFEADAPEQWRVSFRVIATADRRRPAGIPEVQFAQAGETSSTACRLEAGGPLRSRFRSAWPLAERYEALLRVFNDPAPYARRLARRLLRCGRDLADLLRAPPEAAHRVEGFDEAGECAEAAWRRRRESG